MHHGPNLVELKPLARFSREVALNLKWRTVGELQLVADLSNLLIWHFNNQFAYDGFSLKFVFEMNLLPLRAEANPGRN